jgi:alanine racemase
MRSTIARVNTKNLEHNVDVIRQTAPGSKILAIVKANAYGHGLEKVSSVMRHKGVEFLGVAFAEEGAMLRRAGDTGNIVVIAPATKEDAEIICEHDLQPAISSTEFINYLSQVAQKMNKTIKVHLFIDTGMNREGVKPPFVVPFMRQWVKLPNIKFIGICTHFATSSSNLEHARFQLGIFKDTISELQFLGYNFDYIHTTNTGGIFNLPEAHFNLVRPGIGIYGLSPSDVPPAELGLKPVLSLITKVIQVRRIAKGDSVGYERAYIAEKPTNIATIPIGYGDGFLRVLSNKAQCLINGKRYNFISNICMDLAMIDLDNEVVEEGAEVVLIGSQGNETITANELASKIDSIPYEILTAIASRVPRIYYEE